MANRDWVDVLALRAADAQRMVDERAATTPLLADYLVKAAPRRIPVYSITPVAAEVVA